MQKDRIRLTIDLDKSDFRLLGKIAGDQNDKRKKSEIIRKGLRIVAGLAEEEYFLVTKSGAKIPNRIIFS